MPDNLSVIYQIDKTIRLIVLQQQYTDSLETTPIVRKISLMGTGGPYQPRVTGMLSRSAESTRAQRRPGRSMVAGLFATAINLVDIGIDQAIGCLRA